MKDETIFIQIASYRDPELPITLKSCIENAHRPENLRFSICRQFKEGDKFDEIPLYEDDARFKVVTYLGKKLKVFVGLEILFKMNITERLILYS